MLQTAKGLLLLVSLKGLFRHDQFYWRQSHLCIWLLLLAAGTLVAAAAVAVVAVSSCLSATPPFVACRFTALLCSGQNESLCLGLALPGTQGR